MSTELKSNTKPIHLGQPSFDGREVEAIKKVFDSPWVLDGPHVRKFEEAFRNYIGAPYAASMCNCTAGMHIALNALGLKQGDEVLLPVFNFAAAGLAVLQAGCRPLFVDVNPITGNLDPKDAEKRITDKTKAILVLHYSGRPAAMDQIFTLARKHNLRIVEDAAHALGAVYQGRKIGTLGDATVFSFGPLKMICTGMGGMVTSQDAAVNEKLVTLRSYGMNKSMWNRQESKMPWSYSVTDLGHNFRMTDFQAALGIVQLEKLDEFIRLRKKYANQYDESLKDLKIVKFFEPEENAVSVPLYYSIKIIKKGDLTIRDRLALFLKECGIGVSVHWDPALHLHPLYQSLGYQEGQYPHSELLTKQVLSLPLSPVISENEVNYIIEKMRFFCKKEQ